MKVCSRCGFEGDDCLFKKTRNKCKKCANKDEREYFKKNKDKILGYKKEYRKKNKDKILEHQKWYDKKNKDKISEYKKEYRKKNKDKISEKNKEYRKKNRSAILVKRRICQKNRLVVDPVFKLRRNCSRLILSALKGNKNKLSILDYLPYTMDELKNYLESKFDDKMNWDNYGSYWQIDHIIPQSLFPYTSMEDDNFKKCWALDNLQPMEATANLKKSNKVIAQ